MRQGTLMGENPVQGVWVGAPVQPSDWRSVLRKVTSPCVDLFASVCLPV